MENTGLINRRRKVSKLQMHEWIPGYLFILPNFIGFAVFMLLPIIMGLGMSFTDYNGFNVLNFIGFDNFIKMFRDSYFQVSIRNNAVYTLTTVPCIIVLALLIAVALNRGKLKFLRVLYFFPSITATIAIAIVWMAMYHPTAGPINAILIGFGITNPPQWLASTQWALHSVIIVVIWRGIGYYMVMFMAGLQNIPGTIYEAAEIDGANSINLFFKITLPLMTPTIFLCLVLCVINSFQVFDIIFQMTDGGPGRATNVLVYRIYQEAFQNMSFGYASAMALFLFMIIFVVTLVQFWIQKRWVYEM